MKARGFYSIAEPFEEKETEKNAAQYKILESKAKASCFHFGLLLFSTIGISPSATCGQFLKKEIVCLSYTW